MVKMEKTEKMEITANVVQKDDLVNQEKTVVGAMMVNKVPQDVPVSTAKMDNKGNLVHQE